MPVVRVSDWVCTNESWLFRAFTPVPNFATAELTAVMAVFTAARTAEAVALVVKVEPAVMVARAPPELPRPRFWAATVTLILPEALAREKTLEPRVLIRLTPLKSEVETILPI